MFTVITDTDSFVIEVTGETETHILYRRVGLGEVKVRQISKSVWNVCRRIGGIIPKQ